MFNKIGKLAAIILVIFSFSTIINAQENEKDLLSDAPEVQIDGANGKKLKGKEYRKDGVIIGTVAEGNSQEDFDAVVKYASKQLDDYRREHPNPDKPKEQGIPSFIHQMGVSLCGIAKWDSVKEGTGNIGDRENEQANVWAKTVTDFYWTAFPTCLAVVNLDLAGSLGLQTFKAKYPADILNTTHTACTNGATVTYAGGIPEGFSAAVIPDRGCVAFVSPKVTNQSIMYTNIPGVKWNIAQKNGGLVGNYSNRGMVQVEGRVWFPFATADTDRYPLLTDPVFFDGFIVLLQLLIVWLVYSFMKRTNKFSHTKKSLK